MFKFQFSKMRDAVAVQAADFQIGVRELAELAGVAPMTMSRIVTGQSSGQGETLTKVRRASKPPA